MNKFLEMKERGETIPFSDLLKDIPPDDVLAELFPALDGRKRPLVTHREMQVLKLRLDGLTQAGIAGKLQLTPAQTSYSSARIKNALHKNVPPYVKVDSPALGKILGMDTSAPAQCTTRAERVPAPPPPSLDYKNIVSIFDQPIFLLLTWSEIQIIIDALKLYEQELAAASAMPTVSAGTEESPLQVETVTGLLNRAQTAIANREHKKDVR